MDYKQHTNCRVCNHNLTPYLDLGYLPLSNNLATSKNDPIHNERYPLQVMLCENCGLSQLSIVIPPQKMFSHYVYRSSISQGYINHCRDMANDLKKRYGLTEDSFVIDIAGNDGALLMQFKDIIECRCLNVDPAKNLYKHNEDNGIRMYCTFWGTDAAKHLQSTYWPKADIITATNVFAHVDDVREFIDAAKMVLKDTGKLILEFPYLIDFIENREFDTVYFEHLSYFSIHPLKMLVQQAGLEIESVGKQHIHGGSVRVTIGYGEPDETVEELITAEAKLNIKTYTAFADDVRKSIASFREFMLTHDNVAGFAASAKGNTLLNCAGITPDQMRYIVDQTPEKIGLFSPGTGIQIVQPLQLVTDPPEYLVILSWNFKDEIMAKCRQFGYEGKFVIPIPQCLIV